MSLWQYYYDKVNNYLVLDLQEAKFSDFEQKMANNLPMYFLTCGYDNRFEGVEDVVKYCGNVLLDGQGVEQMAQDEMKVATHLQVLKYNVSGLMMIGKYMQNGSFTSEDFFDIVEQFIGTYYASIEHLLNPEQIVFDIDKIFYDFRTKKAYMVYVPASGIKLKYSFKDLIYEFCSQISRYDMSNSEIYMKIAQYTNQDMFCVDGLRNIVEYYREDIKKQMKIQNDRYYINNTKCDLQDVYDDPNISVNDSKANTYDTLNPYDISNNYNVQNDLGENWDDFYAQDVVLDQDMACDFPISKTKQKANLKALEDNTQEVNIKTIIKKMFVVYTILSVVFALLLINSDDLFGSGTEVKLFIGILFLVICFYVYLRVFHEDIIEYRQQLAKKDQVVLKKRINLKGLEKQQNMSKATKVHSNSNMPKPTMISKELQLQKLQNMKMPKLRINAHMPMPNPVITATTEPPKPPATALKPPSTPSTGRPDRMMSSSYTKADYDSYCETEFLNKDNLQYLSNINTGEKIYLDKDSIKVGRSRQHNDYVIESNAVGRFHLEITKEADQVYIMDLGSKNGTFVNNKRVLPHSKIRLNNDDIVVVADNSFRLKSDIP